MQDPARGILYDVDMVKGSDCVHNTPSAPQPSGAIITPRKETDIESREVYLIVFEACRHSKTIGSALLP